MSLLLHSCQWEVQKGIAGQLVMKVFSQFHHTKSVTLIFMGDPFLDPLQILKNTGK